MLLTLESFQGSIRGQSVQILSNNMTAVAYLNHFRGHNPQMNRLTQTIFMLCQELRIQLSAKFLQGLANSYAYFLSRQKSTYKWMLHPGIFKMLDIKFGPRTIGRFASITTAQLQVYNSYFHDPMYCRSGCYGSVRLGRSQQLHQSPTHTYTKNL